MQTGIALVQGVQLCVLFSPVLQHAFYQNVIRQILFCVALRSPQLVWALSRKHKGMLGESAIRAGCRYWDYQQGRQRLFKTSPDVFAQDILAF